MQLILTKASIAGCVPHCIAFSNDAFYHGRLEPRRLPPVSTKRLDPAIVDVRVPGGRKRGKVNEIEAKAVVNYLVRELSDHGDLRRHSAGVAVISLLGVEQARLCRRLALDALSDAQLARHRVVFGEPATFQGDERDVVLLSMVASPKESPAQIGRMYDQRFNVAMSRARDRVVLFRSLDRSDVANADDLKHRLIAFFTNATARRSERGHTLCRRRTSVTGAEGDLLEWLDRAMYKYELPPPSFAGAIAVVEDRSDDSRICVCLDGSPSSAGIEEWVEQLKEQRVLERSGWRFVRVWYSAWLTNQTRCQRIIAASCGAAGVRPLDCDQGVSSEQPSTEVPHHDDELPSCEVPGHNEGSCGFKKRARVDKYHEESEDCQEAPRPKKRNKAATIATKQSVESACANSHIPRKRFRYRISEEGDFGEGENECIDLTS